MKTKDQIKERIQTLKESKNNTSILQGKTHIRLNEEIKTLQWVLIPQEEEKYILEYLDNPYPLYLIISPEANLHDHNRKTTSKKRATTFDSEQEAKQYIINNLDIKEWGWKLLTN